MQSSHRSEGLFDELPLRDSARREVSPETLGTGDSSKGDSGRTTPGSNREAGKPSPADREAARNLLAVALRTDPATRELRLPGVPRVPAGWKGATDEAEVRNILLRQFGARGGLSLYLKRGPEWFRELALKRWNKLG